MKTGKLLYKIFLSLCYIVSAACFFFPFFKVTFSSSFGSINADIIAEYILGEDFSKYLSISPVDIIKLCIDSPEYIDAGKLLVESVFFFVIPFFLALAGAAVVLAVKKSRSAGLISCITGFAGALLNILLRVFLSANQSDFYGVSISLSNFLSVELAANISLSMFIISAVASVLMIFLLKDDESTVGTVPAIDYSQNNGGFVFDNAGFDSGYAPVGAEPAPYNGTYQEDKPTERVTDAMLNGFNTEDSPTVRLDGVGVQKTGILECTDGMYQGMKFPVSIGEEIIIGRDSSQAHIVLDNSYIYVSKKHCGILYESGERYRVRVYSSNGIFVNGSERIEQGAEIYMYPGSVISVGNKENSFVLR